MSGVKYTRVRGEKDFEEQDVKIYSMKQKMVGLHLQKMGF
jgi:hypothetical protein